MGTGNFCQYDAKKIYAIDDRDDEFIWSDTRMNVSCELETKAKELRRYWSENDSLRIERLRSHDATSIGEYGDYFTYYGVEWHIGLIVKTVSGYYEGFSLDYDITITSDISNTEYTNEDDWVMDIITFDSDCLPYKGLFLANTDKTKRKIKEMIDTLQDEVETIFEEYSTPLIMVAQFSNGEAVYKTA